MLGLLIECEKKQREVYKEQQRSAPGSALPPTPLLNHNSLLLLALRPALRYLRKAGSGADPRKLLALGVETVALAGGDAAHARLVLDVPQGAEAYLTAAVSAENARALALLAPELAACVAQGARRGPPPDASEKAAEASDLFTPSAVWRALLVSTLRRCEAMAPSEAVEHARNAASVLPRLSTSHIATALLALRPRASSRPTPPSTPHAVASISPPSPPSPPSPHPSPALPADALACMLDAACSTLRSRVLAGLSTQLLRAADPAAGGGRGGRQGRVHDCMVAWRSVRRRRAHVAVVQKLQEAAKATAAAGGEGASAMLTDLCESWSAAGGDASASVDALVAAACSTDAPASARRQAVTLVLDRWCDIFGPAEAVAPEEARGAAGAENSAGGERGERCGHPSLSLEGVVCVAAERALATLRGARVAGWAPADPPAAFEALRRALQLSGAANAAARSATLSFARDEAVAERVRARALGILVAECGGEQPGGGGDEAGAMGELASRLHARDSVRRVWEGAAAESLCAVLAAAALRTHVGAAAAARSLLAAVDSDGRRATAQLCVAAGLIASWRTRLCVAGGDAPPLHEETAALLARAFEAGGESALLDAREATTLPPVTDHADDGGGGGGSTEGGGDDDDDGLAVRAAALAAVMTIGEEVSLAAAVRAAARARGDVTACERTCASLALLSQHATLEQGALAFLSTAAAPAPDARIAALIVRNGHLPAVASTAYWPKLLPLLSAASGAACHRVLGLSITTLCGAQLYHHAGALLLAHHGCHPALRSPGAELAAVRAFASASPPPSAHGWMSAKRRAALGQEIERLLG